MINNKKVIYVLSPYRSDDPEVVAKRVYECDRYCAHLFNHGFVPICTVSSGHRLTEQFQISDDFEVWRENCHTLIDICGEVHILLQEGWEESTGLGDEKEYIDKIRKPFRVVTIHASGDFVWSTQLNQSRF